MIIPINLRLNFLIMPKLTMQQIFGSNVEVNANPLEEIAKVTINLADFRNEDDGGQIKDGLGITDLDTFTAGLDNGEKAEALLYSIILMTSQNQGEDINEDIEQKLFISEGGTRLGIGARSSQIQRVANVNIFQDVQINNLPDIDAV